MSHTDIAPIHMESVSYTSRHLQLIASTVYTHTVP